MFPRCQVLLIGLFLYETTLRGGDKGDAYMTHGKGKFIDQTMSGLEWEGELVGEINRAGGVG